MKKRRLLIASLALALLIGGFGAYGVSTQGTDPPFGFNNAEVVNI